MKKLLAFILLLIYFTASSGFVVNIHYCMDRLDSVELGSNDEEKTCGKCGMHKDGNKCCRDDVKLVKLQTSHMAALAEVPPFALQPLEVPLPAFHATPFFNFRSYAPAVAHSPPLDEQDIYLRIRVFRI